MSGGGTPSGRAVRALARRIGCTEGQAYTLVIGLVVALGSAMIGVPPALRQAPATVAERPRAAETAPPAPPPRTVTGVVATPAPVRVATPAPAPPAPFASAPASPPPSTPTPEPAFADGGAFGETQTFAHVRRPGAPDGIAVGPAGDVWVSTNNAEGPPAVFRYAPGGALAARVAFPDDEAGGLTGVVLDGAGRALVLDPPRARVVRIGPGGARQTYARIADLPSCVLVLSRGPCQPGAEDRRPLPRAAAFDDTGALFVSDAAQATIWRVEPGGGDAEVWHQSAEYLSGPTGLAFDAAGHLVFAVAATATTGGAVYLLEVTAQGRPGTRTTLAALGSDASPAGLALAASGRVYVALSGTDEVLVLEADGAERARIADAVFSRPSGVAFRGRSILVTNRDGDDPTRWVVLRVSVQEAGLPS